MKEPTVKQIQRAMKKANRKVLKKQEGNFNEPDIIKRVLDLLTNEKKSRAKEALPLFMRLRLAKEQQR